MSGCFHKKNEKISTEEVFDTISPRKIRTQM